MKDPPTQGEILVRLVKTDEKIRQRWAKEVRENKPEGVSLTQIIERNDSFMANLWMVDIEHSSRGPKGGGPRP